MAKGKIVHNEYYSLYATLIDFLYLRQCFQSHLLHICSTWKSAKFLCNKDVEMHLLTRLDDYSIQVITIIW